MREWSSSIIQSLSSSDDDDEEDASEPDESVAGGAASSRLRSVLPFSNEIAPRLRFIRETGEGARVASRVPAVLYCKTAEVVLRYGIQYK